MRVYREQDLGGSRALDRRYGKDQEMRRHPGGDLRPWRADRADYIRLLLRHGETWSGICRRLGVGRQTIANAKRAGT